MLRTLAVVVLLLAGVAACGGEDPDPTGSWGTDAPGQPNLTLGEDGKVSGTDGCNRLVSTWKQDGDTVTFSVVASTNMHCEGVDTWLSGMHTATVSGDTLTVADADGDTIGTLRRR
jgi:heat shock protein HslJ